MDTFSAAYKTTCKFVRANIVRIQFQDLFLKICPFDNHKKQGPHICTSIKRQHLY